MIHAHDFVAAAPRRAPLPRRADLTPMTPATYVRLRRMAAGLTEQQLADRLAVLYRRERPGFAVTHPIGAHMLHVVRALEMPNAKARLRETVDAIAAVMPFDADVYWQLRDNKPTRHPRVCRGCGCSQHDACQHDHWGNCSWASPTQCSHCARKVRG